MFPSEAKEDFFPLRDNKDHVSVGKRQILLTSLFKNKGSSVSKVSDINPDTNPLCVLYPSGPLSTAPDKM